jgi:hypothetical protein
MITPRAVAVWLALTLVWAPLPFGSVTPLGLLILRLALAAGALMLAWCAYEPGVLRPVRVPVLCLGGLGLLGLVQSLPWPAVLARLVSPGHATLANALPDAALGGAGRHGVALSLAPEASRSVALTVVLLAAALAGGAVAGRSVRGRVLLLSGLSAAVLFQVAYGLRNWLAESVEIWGRPADMPGGLRLRGTFVNADHLAILLEIGMAAFLGWLWWGARRVAGTPALDRRLLLVVPPLACWLAAAVGLVLTGSRAALVAAVVGTVVQVLAMFGRSRLRWAPVALLPLAVGLGLVLLAGPQAGFSRLAATSWDELVTNPRFRIWGFALAVWRRFPGTGSGLGSWEEAATPFLPADLAATRWNRAHNDYLELLATGGIVGVLLLAAALAWWLAAVARRAGVTRPSLERATAQAALGACAAVGVHELFDFGLTVPANAVVLLALAGAAASELSRARSSVAPGLVPRRGS